jgi:uncharacterized protein
MRNIEPISAGIGGALIGLSAVMLMLLTGRITGITGILPDFFPLGEVTARGE